MTHNVDIAATIEEINEARNTAMLTLGARYRVEVLLPLCEAEITTEKRIDLIGEHAQELGRIDVLHEQQLDEIARILQIARSRAKEQGI